MSRLIELTEKALNSGLSEEENNEFETLWNSQEEGFEEAVTLLETEALLNGIFFDSNMEKAIFEEILSRSSDLAADNVMQAIRAKSKKPDIKSIQRREKASCYPIIYAIAACILIGFILFSNLSKIKEQNIASVSKVDGVITLKRQGKETHLKTNSLIKPGDELLTNATSKIDVKLSDGTGLSIEESTSISVNKNEDAWELSLSKGTVKTKVSPQKKSFKLKTPALEVKVLGTQFAVTHINGISTVTVFEGKVVTTSIADGVTTTLQAGQSFSADKKKTLFNTSKENIVFADNFEDRALKPILTFAELIQTKDAPWGNNSKWCIETSVSIQNDPNKKKYEVRGPQWEDNSNGLFTFKPGMKIKFKYWINEHNFWVGVWMRVNNKNINLYTSIENPAVKRWAEAEVDLSELTSKVTGQKLSAGDIVNRLNLQSNPNEKAVLYIDDVRVVEE